MGALASAMAHELNQPLAAIANYLEAAGRYLGRAPGGADPNAIFAIEAASGCALRAGDIIRRLRAMLVHGDARRQPVSVAELIAEARALAAIGGAEAAVDYRQNVSPALYVEADPVQIQQVLFNLLRNALDSMQTCEERSLRVRASAKGGMVEIVIRDTGVGVPAETRALMFEPFVSTKEDGMGVGLSICRTIVEAHGGRIWAEWPAGGGTAFHLTLPRISRPA